MPRQIEPKSKSDSLCASNVGYEDDDRATFPFSNLRRHFFLFLIIAIMPSKPTTAAHKAWYANIIDAAVTIVSYCPLLEPFIKILEFKRC